MPKNFQIFKVGKYVSHFFFTLCGKGCLLLRECLKHCPAELSAGREMLRICVLPRLAPDHVTCGLCGQGTEFVHFMEVNITCKYYK